MATHRRIAIWVGLFFLDHHMLVGQFLIDPLGQLWQRRTCGECVGFAKWTESYVGVITSATQSSDFAGPPEKTQS
jgi:hypothetical protein